MEGKGEEIGRPPSTQIFGCASDYLVFSLYHSSGAHRQTDSQVERERERERDRATVHGDSALYAEALSVAIVAYLKRFPRI